MVEPKKGIEFNEPGEVMKIQVNHHLTKSVLIGENKADG